MKRCGVYACMHVCSVCACLVYCMCRLGKHAATLVLVYLVTVHSAKTVARNREW